MCDYLYTNVSETKVTMAMFLPRLSPPSSSPPPSSSSQRRLTRAKQLRHLRDCDVKDLEFFLNSPVGHRDEREGNVNVTTADVFSPPPPPPPSPPPPPLPQPLPLPDLSALFSSADKVVREKRKSKLKPAKAKADTFRLPSPTGVSKDRDRERVLEKLPGTAWNSKEECQDGRRSTDDTLRRVDALHRIDLQSSVDTHRRVQRADTWSSRNVQQKIAGVDQVQKNLHVDVTFRSAPPSANTSPMVSPQRMLNGDMFSSYHEDPTRWPETTTRLGFPHTIKGEGNMVGLSRDSSVLQITPRAGFKPSRKSISGPASPRHPKLNIELSSSYKDNALVNVHPLPLPPTPVSLSQASSLPQITKRPKNSPVRNQWTKGKPIGRGTFGTVYVATNRETGALCAMKEVELCANDAKSTECMRQLEQEIKVLSHLKHPNIVQYYGSEIEDDRFYIYLEYVYPGSINKYVHDHCGAITEAVVRNFTRHICSGLAYLHGRKTIHRDIKGANLLVDSSGVVKLADFGMAKHLSGQAAELSLKGSPYWMAPELMQSVLQKDNNSDLALAVDIWSLGCTIIEMLTGKPPWSEYEGAAAMFKVLKESPPIPETLSPEGKDFLNCCFRRNPADRPPASKLLEHPFLKNPQQLEVLTSSPALNFTNQMDKGHSPKELQNHKLDKVQMSPSRWAANGKGSINETGLLLNPETSDVTMNPRHSPRSILEPVSSLFPKILASPNFSHNMISGAERTVFSPKLWT